MKSERLPARFVVCVRNDGSDDIETRKVYQILPDRSAVRDGYVRVIDESGEDYLYPAEYFVPVKLPVSIAQELMSRSMRWRPRHRIGAPDESVSSRQWRRITTLKDPRKELGKGLLRAVCSDLGIKPQIFEEARMFAFGYPAKLTPDEDGRLVVRFPDFPEAVTDGKDFADALAEASDCLASVIAMRMSRKEAIPPPSPVKRGQRLVSVSLWLAPKLALYSAMREQRITNSDSTSNRTRLANTPPGPSVPK